jgi:hypothetical protein
MPYPKMVRIKQVFDGPPPIKDIPGAVHQALNPLGLDSIIKPGQTVAITAGSRGITNIALIVKSIVTELKAIRAQPFIVPTMGSHGGAIAEGQVDILRELGITEESIGVPIKSSMEVVKIGETLGFPVYIDRLASGANHIAVVERVKPQIGLSMDIGSGLHKMMAIGLGKQKGAATYHRAMMRYGYPKVIRHVGQEVLKRAKVAFALGIVENAYAQTAKIEAALPDDIERKENELLNLAKSWMMKLPFNEVDVLIVNEIGKYISGDGMETIVIGRSNDPLDTIKEPKVTRIIALDLANDSFGNAIGIGMADFTTKRLVDKMDRNVTYINCLTGYVTDNGKIPMYFDTDEEVIERALNSLYVEPEAARIIRIKNTKSLGEVEVSETYMPLLKNRKDLIQINEPKELQFDAQGTISSF